MIHQLEAALYGAGFHVISLSSPTYANFIQSASSTRMPGRTSVDAADLYHVMEKVWEANKSKIEVTDFHVIGQPPDREHHGGAVGRVGPRHPHRPASA